MHLRCMLCMHTEEEKTVYNALPMARAIDCDFLTKHQKQKELNETKNRTGTKKGIEKMGKKVCFPAEYSIS